MIAMTAGTDHPEQLSAGDLGAGADSGVTGSYVVLTAPCSTTTTPRSATTPRERDPSGGAARDRGSGRLPDRLLDDQPANRVRAGRTP